MADLPQGKQGLFDAEEDAPKGQPRIGFRPRDLPLGHESPFSAVMTDTPSGAKDDPPGMVERGNIDLQMRPIVNNPDGSTSSVFSSSFNDGKNEVLIPQVADGGVILTMPKAIEQYEKTGKHLGKFSTPEHADAYANTLHNDYAAGKIKGYPDLSKEPIEGYELNRIHRGISRGFAPQSAPGGFDGAKNR